MSTEVKLGTRHALRVLRPGPFRRYIIGSAISDTGTWMQVMAQGYVMSTLTNKATKRFCSVWPISLLVCQCSC